MADVYAKMDMQFSLVQRLSSNDSVIQHELDDLSKDIMVQVNIIHLMLNPEKTSQATLRESLQQNLSFLSAHFSNPQQAATQSSHAVYLQIKKSAFDALTEIGMETWRQSKRCSRLTSISSTLCRLRLSCGGGANKYSTQCKWCLDPLLVSNSVSRGSYSFRYHRIYLEMFSSFTEKQKRIIISIYVAFLIPCSFFTISLRVGSDELQWVIWAFLNGLFWLGVGLINWIRRANN